MTIAEPPHEHIDAFSEVSPEWTVGAIVQIFRRRLWVFALCVLIVTALGNTYILVTPKVYDAKTVVQVEQNERPVVNTASAAPEDLATPEILKTFEQNLDSGALLLRVFKENKLDRDPRYLSEKKGLFQMVLKNAAHLFSGSVDGPPGDAALIREMDGRTTVKLRRGTRLIDVTFRAQDASLAQQLSQSIANESIRLDFQQKIEAAKPSLQYLLAEAERLKARLQKSQQALQSYKEEQHAVSLEASQNIVVETLKSLNARLSDARSTRIALSSDFGKLEASKGNSNELLSLAGVAASPDVLALKQRITEMEGGLAGIGQRYTLNSPRYLQAESELKKLKLSLERYIQDAASIIRSSYASARATEDKLVAALEEQEKKALELNRMALQYNVLAREVDSDQALYEAVLKQLKETQIIQGIEQSGIRIVEPATRPDKASSPKKSIVLAIALFLGGTIGVAAAIGPALYKAPLVGVSDAERRLGIAVIGAIPKAPGRRSSQPVLLPDSPRTPAAEAIRSLRSMLLLRTRGSKCKIIVFTSALSGEGTTFCAINLAAATAIDGHPTLLVDANLRAPAIGAQLLKKQPESGLCELLTGKTGLEATILKSNVENLSILPAGSRTDHASEVLGSSKMAELLAKVSASYEYIIFDTPPILETSDALRIVMHADLVCLVALSGDTPGRAVGRAVQLLMSPDGIPTVSLILNKIPRGIAC